MNAKGKKLAAIDLIKNRIFEEMSNTEPVDIASVKWKELKNLINECDVNSVGIGTYFRHFWNSCYGQAGENTLYDYLNTLIPQKDQFIEKFIEFSYSKKSTPSNLKCKYALNKLNCYYQNKEIFEDDSSIEHILPEANKGKSNNIGNLIILEESINNGVDNIPFGEKKKIYQKSNYKWVKAFLDKYDEWDDTMIIERAKMLASIYYDKILEF